MVYLQLVELIVSSPDNAQWGKNEFDAERQSALLPLKARLKEVTNFLGTDNIKTQVLGKIAKNYYFSGKG